MLPLPTQLFTKDVAASVAFYESLGFELTTTVPENPPWESAMLTGGLTVLIFQDVNDQNGGAEAGTEATQQLQFKVNGLDACFDFVKDRAKVISPPARTDWGTREFSIEDNNGYRLTFSEAE